MKPFSFLHKPRFPSELLKLNHPIKYIALLFFVYSIGWGIVTPIFPLYLNSLFGNYKAVGIIAAALDFFALCIGLCLGPLLNRLQKRSVIKVALFLYLPFS